MNKEKKKESLQFLLAAAKEIFGEKKLLGMLVAEGAPKNKNLVEFLTTSFIRGTTFNLSLIHI